MSQVQIQAKNHVWLSQYLYCCAGNMQGVRVCELGTMGVPYNR